MKRTYWALVHKMPCRVQHALCSLCREEGLCGRCIIRKFDEWGGHAFPPEQAANFYADVSSTDGIRVVVPTATWSGGTTITLKPEA